MPPVLSSISDEPHFELIERLPCLSTVAPDADATTAAAVDTLKLSDPSPPVPHPSTALGLSRFIIVDLSGPSVPQELYSTVPHFKIPFVPILEKGNRKYEMFSDILEYDWVMKPIIEFDTTESLIDSIPSKIVMPAEKRLEKRQRLLLELLGK